ncbi:MAG TPA: hypothetical protein VE781_04200 [Kineosporiaceae bacterium]|jgi:hypothetical protein|nr:hypothetical protein [Kineosporiaceae bacterium]
MGSTGPAGDGQEVPLTVDAVGEASEADAQEQLQDALPVGDDPEAAVGGLTGRDLDTALSSADEADLAEQASEVPYDDDEL